MPRIAMIGGGSAIFSATPLNDLLQTPCLEGSTYVLMGPTLSKLRKVEEYVNRIIRKNGLKAEVRSTIDQREAVEGADYMVTMFQVGGMEAYKSDYTIPLTW